MEDRQLKVMFSHSGNGGRLSRLTLPIKWMDYLGITPEEREVIVTLNKDNEIIIKKIDRRAIVEKKNN